MFTAFDPTNTGKFSIYDLKDTLADIGENLPDDEIEHMFRKADFDEDNFVTQEDFYNIVTKKVYDEEPINTKPPLSAAKSSSSMLKSGPKRSSKF